MITDGTTILTIAVKHSFGMKSKAVWHTAFDRPKFLQWFAIRVYNNYSIRYGSTVEREGLRDLPRHGENTKSFVSGTFSMHVFSDPV